MTPEKLRHLRLFTWIFLVAGLCMIPYGMFCLRRDRPSLQWPTVPGVMMQADVRRGITRHSQTDRLTATYSYEVNGARHVSHQVRLWNSDLGNTGNAAAFAQAHPVRSTVEVHYDPQNPANAVLIPGANEFADQQFIWAGPVVIILSAYQLLRIRKQYARLIAASPRTGSTAAKPPKSELSSEPFMSYEPGAKRKLNCFRTRNVCWRCLATRGKNSRTGRLKIASLIGAAECSGWSPIQNARNTNSNPLAKPGPGRKSSNWPPGTPLPSRRTLRPFTARSSVRPRRKESASSCKAWMHYRPPLFGFGSVSFYFWRWFSSR